MRSFVFATLGAALALTALSGCPDRTLALLPPVTAGQATKLIPISADIDILFVIDDSPSTADKQAVFVSNFPKFVAALDAFPTGRPNVHLGVVSSSVDIKNASFGSGCPSPNLSEDGRLQNTARQTGCSPPNNGARYLEDIKLPDGSRQTNYTGTLDTALSCIAELGAAGCGFEADLEGMKKSLDGSRAENNGFLRPGAYLAVIFLTDEDDCSVKDYSLFNLDMNQVGAGDFRCQPLYAYDCDEPLTTTPGTYHNCKPKTGSYLQDTKFYHDFLAGLKSPGQIVVAALAGDPKSDVVSTGALSMPFVQGLALLPSCMTMINGNLQIGRPGIRMNDFVQQFGDHGLYDTICQSDYSQALTDIGTLLFKSVSPCLDGDVDPTDINPTNPGIQPDCAVSDVVNLNTPQQTETQIVNCPMTDPNTPDPAGARPCWWVKTNAAACMTAPNLEIHVERASSPPAGDNVQVSCAIH
jgi:hypothetical protein